MIYDLARETNDIDRLIREKYGKLIVQRFPFLIFCPPKYRLREQNVLYVLSFFFSIVALWPLAYFLGFSHLPKDTADAEFSYGAFACLAAMGLPLFVMWYSERRFKAKCLDIPLRTREEMCKDLLRITKTFSVSSDAFIDNLDKLAAVEDLKESPSFTGFDYSIEAIARHSKKHAQNVLSDNPSDLMAAMDFLLTKESCSLIYFLEKANSALKKIPNQIKSRQFEEEQSKISSLRFRQIEKEFEANEVAPNEK